jgi:hypothetical protein
MNNVNACNIILLVIRGTSLNNEKRSHIIATQIDPSI